MKAIRGGGYTDPSPDYDGAGGGSYAHFLGQVAPITGDPYGPLVNPGPDGGYESSGGGLGHYVDPTDPAVDPMPDDYRPGARLDWRAQLAAQRDLERHLGLSGTLGAFNLDGLFGFTGSPECQDEPDLKLDPETCCKNVLDRLDRIEELVQKIAGKH